MSEAPVFRHEPARCPARHVLGPGRVSKGWVPCLCAEAQALRPMGHQYISCWPLNGTCDWEYREPRHEGRRWVRRPAGPISAGE